MSTPSSALQTLQSVRSAAPPGLRSSPNVEQDFEDYKRICEGFDVSSYPHATETASRIPIFDASTLLSAYITSPHEILQEIYHVLAEGPGVLVIRGTMPSTIIDRANILIETLMKEQRDKKEEVGKADWEWMWNSLGKMGEGDGGLFCDYWGNEVIAMMSKAWLGPNYQITSHMHIVSPGESAQRGHRDYHMAHNTTPDILAFPLPTHRLSQLLTLQSAIAHSAIPHASGPTRFLPYSQLHPKAYQFTRVEEFAGYFEKHWVAVELEKGDAVFFNPGINHAAGENSMETPRPVQLLQVSSCMGVPMELVNRGKLAVDIWPALSALIKPWGSRGTVEEFKDAAGGRVRAIVQAVGSGYTGGVNLDKAKGERNQQVLMWEGLKEGWDIVRMGEVMSVWAGQRVA